VPPAFLAEHDVSESGWIIRLRALDHNQAAEIAAFSYAVGGAAGEMGSGLMPGDELGQAPGAEVVENPVTKRLDPFPHSRKVGVGKRALYLNVGR
jgi:hypothetical protein